MTRKSHNFFGEGLDKAIEKGLYSHGKKIRHAAKTTKYCGVVTVLCATTFIGIPIAFFPGVVTLSAGNRCIKLSEQADQKTAAQVAEPIKIEGAHYI